MGTESLYRPVRTIPYELREHCIIYFEENLHAQALALLKGLLVSNNDSVLPPCQNPAFLPSPHLLALIATLIVHPLTTTRAATSELLEAADLAVEFLDCVNHIVGPVNANFHKAFSFPRAVDASLTRSRKRRKVIKKEDEYECGTPCSSDHASPALGSPMEVEEQDRELVSLKIAHAGGLYARVESFWHAVGWALNCSIRHPERWERWKLWLEIMFQVLERDWTQRLQLAIARNGDIDKCVGAEQLQDSIIVSYISNQTEKGRMTPKRVLRAVFADGEVTSLAEFGEVFDRECELKKTADEGNIRADQVGGHRGRVDIEAGNFGDYFDDDEEEQQDDRADKTKRETERLKTSTRRKGMKDYAYWNYDGSLEIAEESDDVENTAPQTIQDFGGLESMALRRRLLALLANVATYLPEHFISLPDLLNMYDEFTRSLPLPVFSFLIAPSTRKVDDQTQDSAIPVDFNDVTLACLHEMLLQSFVSRSTPSYAYRIPTQRILQSSYLPQAPNSKTITDHARLALVLEALTRLLWRNGLLKGSSEGLRDAHRRGVKARKERTAPDGRKKRNPQPEDECWAQNAETKLELLINMIQMKSSIDCS